MDTTNLPENCEFRLEFLSLRETVRRYGPFGLGEEGLNPGSGLEDGPAPRRWHCTITRYKECPTCNHHEEMFWFKGHGYTREEAINRAFIRARAFLDGTSPVPTEGTAGR